MKKYTLPAELQPCETHYFGGTFELITGTVVEENFLSPQSEMSDAPPPFYVDDDESTNVQVWLQTQKGEKHYCLLQAPETYLAIGNEITFITFETKHRKYFLKLYNHATDTDFFLTDVDDLFKEEYTLYLEKHPVQKFLRTTPILREFVLALNKEENKRQEETKIALIECLVHVTDFADAADGQERHYRSDPQAATFTK